MKIICYSSFTSIWFSTFPEGILAHELQKNGHEVLFITPGNEFPDKSNPVNERIIKKEFKLNGYEIGSVISATDRKEISSIMSKLNKDNHEDLVIDNVEIGKISLYEILLTHKKMDTNFSKEEWKKCLDAIRYTLTSFYACRKILRKEKPDIVIVYNALYSVNRVWVEYAKLLKITPYFLACGGNLSDMSDTLLIAKNHSIHYWNHLKKVWPKLQNIPISKAMAQYVSNHYLELLKANNPLVYSSPRNFKKIDIRKYFNIHLNQKILTATMSSYDELFSAQYTGAWSKPMSLIFRSQEEWIKILIDYVRDKKDLFLLIRVHPREFPNKRNAVKSEHIRILKMLFADLPTNIKVNWPRDLISIYDLAEDTSVFLNAWSSVGVEMSLLGIPVVIYSDKLILYPSNLNYLAKDKHDYFSQIELALKEGWSYSKIKQTYRWLSLQHARTIIRYKNEGTTKPKDDQNVSFSALSNYLNSLLPPKIRIWIAKLFFALPGSGVGDNQRADCRKYLSRNLDFPEIESMLKKRSDSLVEIKTSPVNMITAKEEDKYIRDEIKRIYLTLYDKRPKSTKLIKNSLQYNLSKIR